MTKQEVLQKSNFGHRIAEEEAKELQNYFVATDQWYRTFNGDVDIIYGAKGSGKSALYSLIIERSHELRDKEIVVVSAEIPRGAPVFKDLQQDPPTTEREFMGLWRLYFLSLLGATLKEYSAKDDNAKVVLTYLENAKLLERTTDLRKMLRGVFDYAKRFFRPEAFEGGVKIDPLTGVPNGFTGKITFDDHGETSDNFFISVDELLRKTDKAFIALGTTVWVLLDRLDVAFAESHVLEENALRALFRTYLDFAVLTKIRLKIFLRTDIWNRLTKAGFREASHITRTTTIQWDSPSLLALIIRRIIKNELICKFYKISPETVLASQETQSSLFYRVFPDQIDVSTKKPRTLDWILARTRDGSGQVAPRELIHLLNASREKQLQHFEVGDKELEGEQLISKVAVKESLPEISQVRLTQTLFAEYPTLRPHIEKLAGERAQQYTRTLAQIWGISEADALNIASQLVDVGFFELRGTRTTPYFWVPFLYRDAARVLQGSAD
jgi:hypothetical protein